jgi:hypothetical protein
MCNLCTAALRTMTAMRVEEGVLVSLADRRRALAGRTLGGVGGGGGGGGGGMSAAADAATAGNWIRLSPAEEAEVAYRRAWWGCTTCTEVDPHCLTRKRLVSTLEQRLVSTLGTY